MEDETENYTLISIHSLRVEGDGQAQRPIYNKHISIHSLRVEGDLSMSR